MRFINKARGTGKTSMLINTAYVTGMPIIVNTEHQKQDVLSCAVRMGIDYHHIEVFTLSEWKRGGKKHYDGVLIDEATLILQQVLNEYLDANVVAATMSLEMK